MAYFGGGGVQGALHPSLRAWIDCFQSPPFPKMFPRGGGFWDQDPVLMRDFRVIRDYEIQWKENQEKLEGLKEGTQPSSGGDPGGDLEDLLNEYLDEMGESGTF